MLKFNKKAAIALLGATTLATSIYAANKPIGIQNGQWELIGVNGLHTYSVSTTATGADATGEGAACSDEPCLDMGSNDIAIVDVRDIRMTWDANNSSGNTGTKDFNGYESSTTWYLFGTGDATAPTNAVSLENNGTTFGSSAHSIVGLEVQDNTANSTVGKAVIAIDYDPSNSANIKHYTTGLKTMFLKSDKVTGNAPDIQIAYQATLEGKNFRIQFSERTDGTIAFDYAGGDLIYRGVFDEDRTWDNPAYYDADVNDVDTTGMELAPVPGSVEDTTTTRTTYANINQIFDMNISNNYLEDSANNFNPTTTGVEMLEGNLTVYEFVNGTDADSWKAAILARVNQASVIETRPSDTISLPDSDADGYSEFTVGKGYWVKFDAHATADNFPDYSDHDVDTGVSIPGFLASNNIAATDYTSDIVKPGWNLLAFNDAKLRYTTTGIVISEATIALDNVNIYSEDGAVRIDTDLNGIATNEELCTEINKDIHYANDVNVTGGAIATNKLNVRCYPVSDTDGANHTGYVMLVGDGKFYVDIPKAGVTSISGIRTLTNQPYTVIDANITYPAPGIPTDVGADYTGASASLAYRFESKYGEYLMGVQINPHSLATNGNVAAISNLHKFTMTIPTLETQSTKVEETVTYGAGWDVSDGGTIDINTSVNALATSFGTGANGAGWVKDDTNDTLFIALNKRFYVTDDTYIRVFNISDEAAVLNESTGVYRPIQWTARVVGDGSTADNQFGDSNSSCQVTATAFDDGATNVAQAICIDGVDSVANFGDANNTVMFISNDISNFDVLEADVADKDTGILSTTAANISDADYQSFRDILTDITPTAAVDADGNETVYGAIKEVYNGTNLTGSSLTQAGVYTLSGYNNIANVGNTPVWVESFPNDGPLYYLTQVEDGNGAFLKPEVFLTAVTSNNNGAFDTNKEIVWKAVDVTRDPNDWFDGATGFDLFGTKTGQGYWVYATEGFDPTTAANIIDGSSASTLTGYHHFDNDKIGASDYSKTQNHVDGLLEVRVEGLYRTASTGTQYTSGNSFNVEATMGGQKSQMGTETVVTTSAVKFNVKVSDYETPGISETSAPITASVQAVDGLGGKDTETNIEIPFVKPGQPQLEAVGSDVTIASDYASYVYLFEGNISDTTYASQILGEIPMTVTDNVGEVTINTADTAGIFTSSFSYPAAPADNTVTPAEIVVVNDLTSGQDQTDPTSDVRFVTATNAKQYIGTTTPVFVSDQLHYKFAPVYAGTHILSVNGTGDDDLPADYTQGGTVLAGDAGVKLTNPDGGVTLAIAYPAGIYGGNLGNATFANTLYVGTPDGLNHLATLQYTEGYEGQYFFLYTETGAGAGTMYWGVFPDAISGNAAATPNLFRVTQITGSTQSIVK